MKEIRYLLVDPSKEVLFLGADEGSFYFTEDDDFIEKNLIKKAAVFPSIESASQFTKFIEHKDHRYSLTAVPVKMKNTDRHIDIYSLCEQGYGKYLKGMLFAMDPITNTIH